MVLVIETNLLCNNVWEVLDHQARIVEVDSWEGYIQMYLDNKPEMLKSTMNGMPFFINHAMEDLKYDDKHLSCKFTNGTMKYAYILDEGYELIYKKGD